MEWQDALKAEFDNGALEYLTLGVSAGDFPMNRGDMISWSDWLVLRIETRMSAPPKEQDNKPSEQME